MTTSPGKTGWSLTFVNTSDIDKIEESIRTETKAVFVETPTNPLMQVTDIAEVSQLCKELGLLLIVDNTFLTPYFQRPLDMGADIVLHSGTKYLCGHNDTLAGFLVVSDLGLSERLRFIYKTTGACLSPFDSWLLIRGLKTLPIRIQRQQESAIKIAQWLCGHEKVRAVHYVGLPSHPNYGVSVRQASGFGAMISFELDSERTALGLLENVKIIQYAESLGGAESLITYPMHQTHADLPPELRKLKGINETLLRLSVGLECTEDLIADLEQAMEVS